MVKFYPSLVTTAVVLQANYVTQNAGWSDALEHYSGYTYEAGKLSRSEPFRFKFLQSVEEFPL